MIATSNRPPEDLYKNGLQRSHFLPFIPILKDHCNILCIDSGVDYRQRKSTGKDKFYFAYASLSFTKAFVFEEVMISLKQIHGM